MMLKPEDYGIRGVNNSYSGNQKTKCPKCGPSRRNKHDKSLSVNLDKGVFNCHHCGWHGSLHEKRESYGPIFKKATQVNYEQEYGSPDVSKQEPLSEEWLSWFAGRGISKQTLEDCSVSCEKRNNHDYVCFNFLEDDEFVNVKYRRKDKHFEQAPKCKQIFYNINSIADEKIAIITEGEIDALSFVEAGFPNAISIPSGAMSPNSDPTRASLAYLQHNAKYIEPLDRVYLALDSDTPGIITRDELARRIGKERCLIVSFPDGCKDANDVLVKYGREMLANCLEEAVPYPIDGIMVADDVGTELYDLFNNGYPIVSGTGMQELDDIIRFAPGRLTVVTGAPNSGKSQFVTQLGCMMAVRNGARTAVYSPENYPIEVHVQQMVEQLVGKPMIPGHQMKMRRSDMEQARKFLSSHIFHITSKDEAFTLEDILERTKSMVLRNGINNLVIDPWNNIDHHIPAGKNETTFIGEQLTKIRYFSQKYGIHIFIVAHPRVLLRKRNDDENFEIPTMYHIMGSSNWYNKADNGICVYREFERDGSGTRKTRATRIIIQKIRHRHEGSIGELEVKYIPSNSRFVPIGERDESVIYGPYLSLTTDDSGSTKLF